MSGDRDSSADSQGEQEPAFLRNGGTCGTLIRTLDWSATPLGPIESWSPSLRSALGIMLPSAASIVLFYGPDLIALYNDAYAPTIGDKHPYAMGRPARENWSELWDILEPLLQGVLTSGQTFGAHDYPFRIERHGYLEEVFFDVSYMPLRGPGELIEGVFCIVTETTTRVHAERRLRTLRELSLKLAMLASFDDVAHSAVGTIIRENAADLPYALLYRCDQDGPVLVASGGIELPPPLHRLPPSAGDETGAEEWVAAVHRVAASGWIEEHAGRPPGALTTKGQEPSRLIVLPIEAAREVAGILVIGLNPLLPASGDYRHFLELVAGQISNAVTVIRTLKVQEERSLSLERAVEAAIAERSAIEAQLHQAQKMEAIGKLTGGIAHDFNNLLQVIGGNLQLIERDTADNPKLSRRIELALAGVVRGAKLASQLLAFGRRQPLAPRVVDLSALLVEIDDLLRRPIGERITLIIEPAADLWQALVDPYQVENALLNLAINARDAMPEGGTLSIKADNTMLEADFTERNPNLRPGPYVRLAVRDTGTGIEADLLGQVFEPFFTTKPEGQGTGLGLSMVYGFARQSGGHAEIESRPGEGTTVTLYLPKARPLAAGPSETEAVSPDELRGDGQMILTVEDDPGIERVVMEMLSELGYKARAARDGETALAILEGGLEIDLLLCDIVVPGRLQGAELAAIARERLPALPVLFTSGSDDEAARAALAATPGAALLRKPYGRLDLAQALRRSFDQVDPAASLAPTA